MLEFPDYIILLCIPFVVTVVTSLILSKRYKKKEKVDKGFEFIYFKLSHRRKMIRTLTSLPIVIITFIIIYYFSDWNLAFYISFVLFVSLGLAVQFLYNYKKWKTEEISY